MSDDSNLRDSILESINRLDPELSLPTQAQMTIPIGQVRHLRDAFERRIASHRHEPDSILIGRAMRNTDELIREGRAYAEQLRMVESLSLSRLPESLVGFLRDHDNLYRATIRSRQLAHVAATSTTMDVLTRVAHRILNMRNQCSLSIVRGMTTPTGRVRMMEETNYAEEVKECTNALVDEMFGVLSRLEVLLPNDNNDVELENVGPDHNVEDFGRDVSCASEVFTDTKTATEEVDAKDHSLRCCVCLDSYDSPSHPSFLVEKCSHIIGKSCFATWLNSTSKNANLCPYCRTKLCERRSRRPLPVFSAITAEQMTLVSRLDRALDLMEDISRLFNEFFEDMETGMSDAQWLDNAFVDLNRRLFENGIDFGFARDGFDAIGWRLSRVDWAAGMLRA